jgi:LCP family protein required for cell wall assembly
MVEEKAKGKRKKRKSKVLRNVLIVLACIVFALVLAWQIFVMVGRMSLYKSSSVNQELMAQLTDVDSVSVDVGWQENWIRYDGKVYQYNEDVLSFLILGIDKDSEVQENTGGVSGGQADANFLVVVNPDLETVRIVCINRDCMTTIDTTNMYGQKDATTKAQLCLAHAYGNSPQENAGNSVKAVTNLFYGIPIHGYCAINMAAIADINDSVGGVTLESLETFSKNGYYFTKGKTTTLKGKGAFWYVKYRSTKEFDSNGSRLKRQKQYLNAFIGAAKTTIKKKPSYVINLYNSLAPYMTTDVGIDEAAYLATMVLGYDFDMDNIITLDGETVQGVYYEEFYPDEDSLKRLVIDLFYEEVEGVG